MTHSAKQVNFNYIKALALSSQLVKKEFLMRGYDVDAQQALKENLAQSALADSRVIRLIQSSAYDEAVYKPLLLSALREVKKELFADVDKRRFVSIDNSTALFDQLITSTEDKENDDQQTAKQADILAILHDHLADDSMAYLKKYILHREHEGLRLTRWIFARAPGGLSLSDIQKIVENIKNIQILFPQGNLHFTSLSHPDVRLKNSEVIHCYKNILAGIERSFPANFFRFDAKRRAGEIIRYLLDTYLKRGPENILAQEDSSFFIRYKIQGIYRLFNYSMNRVLYNAYPKSIMPWMQSRIENNYWRMEDHRINAIRWLVEDKLALEISDIKKHMPGRKDFAENGLSYMFITFYNSVSKALRAAYPQMEPWQLGNVPITYWTDENAARAIRTMLQQKNWQPEDLPVLYKNGELNRSVFGKAGLATVFQTKYSRNIYKAISAAYPGQFEPWELGKVPLSFWSDRRNIYRAARWLVAKEGIELASINSILKSDQFNFDSLKKYPVGPALKRYAGKSLIKLFLPLLNREQMKQSEEQRIQKKIRRLIRKETTPHPLVSFLLYGFYRHIVAQVSSEYLFRINSLKKRRQRYRGRAN